MSVQVLALLEDSVQQNLRTELKAWEKAFAAENGGRKAGRSDIKQYPEIAAKYKVYNKIRVQSLSKNPFATQPSSSSPPPPSKKQKVQHSREPEQNAVTVSVSKTHDHSPGPSRALHPSTIDPYDPPSNNPTPTSFRTRQAIGPTPQKNGQVLGLFDLLSPPSAKKAATLIDQTPSKKDRHAYTIRDEPNNLQNTATKRECSSTQVKANLATPSKPRTTHSTNSLAPIGLLSTPFTSRKYSRTPESSGKRKFLDAFLTPSARRANELPGSRSLREEVFGLGTPSSKKIKHLAAEAATGNDADITATPSSKRATKLETAGDETPVFLRRYAAPISRAPFARPIGFRTSLSASSAGVEQVLGKDIPAANAHARPARRKPMARTLSAMVQSLREAEDDRLDEEMEIMRELEMEAKGGSQPKRAEKHHLEEIEREENELDQAKARNDIGEMPLGADGEWEQQEVEPDQDKDSHQVKRTWKKKGQKRTTRRVRMKPQTAKWMPEAEWAGPSDEETELVAPEGQAVADKYDDVFIGETQVMSGIVRNNEDASDVEESNDLAYEEKEEVPKKRGRPKGKAASRKEKEIRADGKAKAPEQAKRKPGRKVNPAAHANFRALKLRNKNSKGGNGRFGRRR